MEKAATLPVGALLRCQARGISVRLPAWLLLDHPGLDLDRPFHLWLTQRALEALTDGLAPAPESSQALRQLTKHGKFAKWRTDGELDVVSWPPDGEIRAKHAKIRRCERIRQRKRRDQPGEGCPRTGPGPTYHPWRDHKLPPRSRAVVIVSIGDWQRFRWKGFVNLDNALDGWIVAQLCCRITDPPDPALEQAAWGYRRSNWTQTRIDARRASPFYRRPRCHRTSCHAGISVLVQLDLKQCTDFRAPEASRAPRARAPTPQKKKQTEIQRNPYTGDVIGPATRAFRARELAFRRFDWAAYAAARDKRLRRGPFG